MANQAIALQARAPQTDFMGRAIQQNAQMMNMLAQQRAAQRQAARTQQEMELARAAEGRAISAEERAARKANQEFIVAEVSRLIDRGAAVGDEAGYQMWLKQVENVSPEDAALFRQYSPTFDRSKMDNILMGAEQYINKTIATPEASFQVGKNLETYSATVGGTRPGVQPLMVEGAPQAAAAGAPAQNPMSAPRATAPATDAQIDEAARAILGGAGIQDGPLRGLSMEDFDRATERANQMTAGGGRMQPISMTTGAQMGGQPDMAAVVQDMMSSGQISQSNLQLMREMAGPDKDAQLAQILKANNIQIVPDDQPGMRSAVFRPGQDAAPRMQLAQATNAPGTQFRVAKDPMQSPAPGTVLVPTPVIRKQAEAEEEGKLGPRIAAEPQIEGGKKTAELRAQRDFEMPQATGRFETNLARLDLMLTEIERLRKHPAYTRIIGPLDAFTPNFGRARGAQAIYNSLMALGTVEELQSMRRSNETGGAVGNVSDADLKLLERGFAALDQSQMEGDFEASIKVLIARIKAARDRLVKEYKDTYSYRLPKSWSPPSPKSKPIQGGRKVGGFTVLEVED